MQPESPKRRSDRLAALQRAASAEAETESDLYPCADSPSTTFRKGQISVLVKVVVWALAFLQIISIPTIGYLMGKWDTMQDMIGSLKQQAAVMETRQDAADKMMERIEIKLDRALQEKGQ